MEINLPNSLTILRVLLVVPFAVAFLDQSFAGRTAAHLLFVVAALTDLYDGLLARRNKEITDFGKIADPIADKLLTGTAFVLLAIFEPRWVPWWAASLILLREVGITAWRLRALRMGRVLPSERLGKWKTGFQLTAIIWALTMHAVGAEGGVALGWRKAFLATDVGWCFENAPLPITLVALALTYASAFAYLRPAKA